CTRPLYYYGSSPFAYW
nr:immunoglobulin heavy chain junction region [Mus musculus]